MGDDFDLNDLCLEGDLDDFPLGKEAERCAREADEGLRYKPKGFVSCPCSWIREILPLFHNSPQQLVAAEIVYSLLRMGQATLLPNRTFAAFGIGRRAKYAALAKLAQAGLIAPDYAPGRTIRAVLLWMPPVQGVVPQQGSINKKEK
jgi:hypothetical protein